MQVTQAQLTQDTGGKDLAKMSVSTGRYTLKGTKNKAEDGAGYTVTLSDRMGIVPTAIIKLKKKPGEKYAIYQDGTLYCLHLRALLASGLKHTALAVLKLEGAPWKLADFDLPQYEAVDGIFTLIAPTGDESLLKCDAPKVNLAGPVKAALQLIKSTAIGNRLHGDLVRLNEKVFIGPIEGKFSHTRTKKSQAEPAIIFVRREDALEVISYWGLGDYDPTRSAFPIVKAQWPNAERSLAALLFHELVHVRNEKFDAVGTLQRLSHKTGDLWDTHEEEEAIKGSCRGEALSAQAVQEKITECHYLREQNMPLRYGHHTGGHPGAWLALDAFLSTYGAYWVKQVHLLKSYRKTLAAALTNKQQSKEAGYIPKVVAPAIEPFLKNAAAYEAASSYDQAAQQLQQAIARVGQL
jgi:hypothetical protein